MTSMTTDSILDSRDLQERLDELEAQGTLDADDTAELEALRELSDVGIEDWQYGATLIRDDYFVEYAQELADDIGAIPSDAAWPLTCIDWNQAARELRMDYTPVEFMGHTYWVR